MSGDERKMIHLKKTKDAAKQEHEVAAGSSDREQYGYGTRFNLEGDTLKKLGLNEGAMPKSGTKLKFMVHGHVADISEHNNNGEITRRMEVQMTHMPHMLGMSKVEGSQNDAAAAKPGAGARKDLENAYAGDKRTQAGK